MCCRLRPKIAWRVGVCVGYGRAPNPRERPRPHDAHRFEARRRSSWSRIPCGRGPARPRAPAVPRAQLGAAGRGPRRPARARRADRRRRHVRADGSLRPHARGRAQRAHDRSCSPRPRGPLGHLRAHGDAALAQAPDGPRHRLSRADVPRLVRGPARRRGLAASLQDRHVGLARLPAMGARHRADRHRQRYRGDEHRSGWGLRARRARWRERVGDGVRPQGRAGRRPRRFG